MTSEALATGGAGRYDAIGHGYASARREDPYIAGHIQAALGSTGSVVNVGAGTGNYEPPGQSVVAIEPSLRMIQQRSGRTGLAVQAVAEALPFRDGAFDVAMAVITLHHWTDPAAGLREMARVAHRQVVAYFEPSQTAQFWALEYFPASARLTTTQDPPGESMLAKHLDLREIRPLLLPRECSDGFGVAFWGRPEALLESDAQAGMSWLAMLSPAERAQGTAKLRADLGSGEWDRRFGHLRRTSFYDGGYRIALAGS